RENEAGYFRSTRTRHPKNSGDSSQALTANSNNTTSYGKNVGCIQDGEEIQQSEDKTTPRSCGIVALKAPQPQSTLTRYYTFTTKRNHEAHKILNADQISPLPSTPQRYRRSLRPIKFVILRRPQDAEGSQPKAQPQTLPRRR